MRNRFSTWYAADLERYNSEYKVNLLSAHKEIINFKVQTWPHLLMVAKSGFEKGPCTIGIKPAIFSEVQQIAKYAKEIWFNNNVLKLYAGGRPYSINWRVGEQISFAPFKINNLAYGKVSKTIEQYCRSLESIELNTPGAVLLGMPGGAEYFREAISAAYPEIIKALLKQNEQELLNFCRKIIGMGHGSSPSGDDLICGALFAYHHFLADPLFIENISTEFKAEAKKTSLMGRHMLEIGLSGLSPVIFKDLLISISRGVFKPDLLKRSLKVGSLTGIELLIALIYFTKNYLKLAETGIII
ncbi:MAG: DUF2877 domain-containing protein [Bacillota bacterium]